MPLPFDVKSDKFRDIEASFPNDTTQEEFWGFVLLVANQLFGISKDLGEGKSISRWNALSSLEAYLENKGYLKNN